MFERFSERARRAVVLAQQESRALGHNYVGTEHVLLGLIASGGTAAAALTEAGVTIEGARAEVARIVGRGNSAPADHLPFTPRAKKVVELSLREALKLGDRGVSTEHLLLGLIREGQGVAMQVLAAFNPDWQELRTIVLRLRQESPRPEATERTGDVESMVEQILRQQQSILERLDRIIERLPPEPQQGGEIREA